MSKAITPAATETGVALSPQLAEIVLQGDLSKLTPAQRVTYYLARCEACGLDPRTQPFQYLLLNGKLTLYATAVATYQAAEARGISFEVTGRQEVGGLFCVTVRALARDGRYTEALGAVASDGLKGEARANAMMKAETKAKRRAVIQLTGMGMLDETETGTIPNARPVMVDTSTGEILEQSPQLPALPAEALPPIRCESNGPVESAKEKTAALVKDLGWAKPWAPRLLALAGGKKTRTEALNAAEWAMLAGILDQCAADRRACFAHWAKICEASGENARDDEQRRAVWSGCLKLDEPMKTSTDLSPGQWAALREELAEMNLGTPPDPFAVE